MATENAGEPIILSTRRAVREVALTFGVIAAIWIAFVFAGHHFGMRSTSGHGPAIAAAGVPLVMALVFPLLAVAGQLGRTVIDDRGLTDQRLLRQPRRLDWSDVRRVRWLQRGATLQGDRVTITIAWEHAYGAGNNQRARERVRRHLERHFDLSDPPSPARSWTWLSTWRVIMVALPLSAFAYYMYRQILAKLADPAQAGLSVSMLMLLLIGPIVMGLIWATASSISHTYRDPDSPARWRPRLT